MTINILSGCNIAVVGKTTDEPQHIKRWVEHASGRVCPAIDDQTTHVIFSDKAWKPQSKVVEDVMQRKERGQKLFIMKYQWLKECLSKKRRLGENKREYSWERDEREAKLEAGKKYKETKEPRSHTGLMGEVFLNSTEAFNDPREQRRIDSQKVAEEAARKEQEEARYQEFMNQQSMQRRKEVAAVFKKGAQKARNELLSDNHHIYTDCTGFSYDVSVTKVDTRNNRNERYSITIYESNGDNPTYAVNCQFGKTGSPPENHVIALLGSNFKSALQAFKTVFKEKTHVEWDNRISAALERIRSEELARGKGTGSPTGTVIGVPVEESQTRSREVRFEDAPFLYHPPRYGPKGELPGQLPLQVVPETGEFVQGPEEQAQGEYMMSGANGDESDSDPREVRRKLFSGKKASRLSSAELKRNEALLKREDEDLGDVYEEPFAFGQDVTAEEQIEEEVQSGRYDGGAADQTPDLLAQFDTFDSALGKRDFSADGTVEGVRLEKKARAYTDKAEGPEVQFAGEGRYEFDFNEPSALDEGAPGGMSEDMQD